MLEVLALLCKSAWLTVSLSESTLFRTIDADCPTLLFDETDALFKSNSERIELIRAVLNAGNKKGVTIPRCVPPKFEIRHFGTYCPKVLAGITTDALPETIRDRAIAIMMRRRRRDEKVTRFRYRHAKALSHDIVARLEKWSESAVKDLADIEPDIPDELLDRMADALEPLIVIADAAGGKWAEDVRDSAVAITKVEADDELGSGAQLLAATRKAFGKADKIHTETLLECVNNDDDAPFGAWREGKGIDSRKLAKLLRRYEIRSKSVRIGEDSKKGYDREDLSDAWARYLPADEPPPAAENGSQGSQGSQDADGSLEIPDEYWDVTHVTDVTPPEQVTESAS